MNVQINGIGNIETTPNPDRKYSQSALFLLEFIIFSFSVLLFEFLVLLLKKTTSLD